MRKNTALAANCPQGIRSMPKPIFNSLIRFSLHPAALVVPLDHLLNALGAVGGDHRVFLGYRRPIKQIPLHGPANHHQTKRLPKLITHNQPVIRQMPHYRHVARVPLVRHLNGLLLRLDPRGIDIQCIALDPVRLQPAL